MAIDFLLNKLQALKDLNLKHNINHLLLQLEDPAIEYKLGLQPK